MAVTILVLVSGNKPVLLSPCTTFIPAIVATLFMSTLEKNKSGERAQLTSVEWAVMST